MSLLLERYHHLHTIPEIGFQEVKTAAYLADQLEAAGFAVTRNVGDTTGIVGVFDSGVAGRGLGSATMYNRAGQLVCVATQELYFGRGRQ